MHAVYRNDHPLGERSNFYRQAADEVTRLWHALSPAFARTSYGT
jgi:hypothetical protein